MRDKKDIFPDTKEDELGESQEDVEVVEDESNFLGAKRDATIKKNLSKSKASCNSKEVEKDDSRYVDEKKSRVPTNRS